MFKIIAEIGYIEYDAFIEKMLNTAKEHPEMLGGQKLPPFSAKMLKLVPQAQKNEMFANQLNENKAQILPQAEMMLARLLGPVHLRDLSIACDAKSVNPVVLTLEISDLDNYTYISRILPVYYSEMNAPQMMGDAYTGSFDLQSITQYMYSCDSMRQRFLIAKSISANKQEIMRMIERGATANEIRLQINNLRIMVK